MSPYVIVGPGSETVEGTSLRARLMAWHDAMVAHERRLRSGNTTDVCDEECPHTEARTLWAEVFVQLGPRASELTFLRLRGAAPAAEPVLHQADTAPRLRASRAASSGPPSQSFKDSSLPSQVATAELSA